MSESFSTLAGNAILGIDTLWGGDVMCPSGTGRFIADSWFSDEPLPPAYTDPAAAPVRASGGVSAKSPNRAAIDAYLAAVDVRGAIAGLAAEGNAMSGLRGEYVRGLALCFEVMWDLAMELLGTGDPVPYERCVQASTGQEPAPSHPEAKRERVAELLARAGHPSRSGEELLAAVDAWRRARRVPMASVRALGGGLHRPVRPPQRREPAALAARRTPRGAARQHPFPADSGRLVLRLDELPGPRAAPGRRPEYEATYEINASLEISVPEFEQLVSHEVVPGHVTTFAYLQNLYVRGLVGFEATVLTMNTRGAALFEGIANNAILIAHGVTEVEQLPGRRPADRRAAGPAPGRRQEPVVLPHLEGRPAAAGGRRRAAPRLPGLRGARREALRRLGPPPAAGAHVPARLPRRHRARRRPAPPLPARASCCPRSTAAPGWWISQPSNPCLRCNPFRGARVQGAWSRHWSYHWLSHSPPLPRLTPSKKRSRWAGNWPRKSSDNRRASMTRSRSNTSAASPGESHVA